MGTTIRRWHRAARALGVAFAALVALTPGRAHAVTIPVTTTGDVIDPSDGLCSLREAIIAANTDTASGEVPGECIAGNGIDTISLPAGTYTLTIAPSGANDAASGDLNITQALTIVGTGHPTVTGGAGWDDGIFDIAAGAAVSMTGFTISGGNRAVADGVSGGGGIRSVGPLTLAGMTISGNATTESGAALATGGGVFIGPSGSLTVARSIISGNSADHSAGGLYSQGTVTMTDTTVSGNSGRGTGGVVLFLYANGSTAIITNSTIVNNHGTQGSGNAAGIDIEANGGTPRTATLRNVTISGNVGTTQVGGLSSFGNLMVLTIIDTLIAGNTAPAAPDCSNQNTATIRSGGNNLIGNDKGCTLADVQPSDQVGTPGSPINPLLGALADNGGSTPTMALLAGSPAIDAGNDATCASIDQRGFGRPAGQRCDVGAFEADAVASTRMVNISTRGRAAVGDQVMIGGFVIGGSVPKTVLVRAIGPSLAAFEVPGVLGDPVVELFSGLVAIARSDDWQTPLPLCQTAGYVCGSPADIVATGLAPTDAAESAILITLPPGPYTAIMSGAGGSTGVGLVEVFELPGGPSDASRLINLSTRGLVGLGDNVMVGGFVLTGSRPKRVLVRAGGPSLAGFGVPAVLANPFLRIFEGQTAIAESDDWMAPLPLCAMTGHTCGDQAEIAATGLAPADPLEAAIVITLPPGAYTAIVSGAGDTIGVGLVEIFELP